MVSVSERGWQGKTNDNLMFRTIKTWVNSSVLFFKKTFFKCCAEVQKKSRQEYNTERYYLENRCKIKPSDRNMDIGIWCSLS